jgi:hypothetical protein
MSSLQAHKTGGFWNISKELLGHLDLEVTENTTGSTESSFRVARHSGATRSSTRILQSELSIAKAYDRRHFGPRAIAAFASSPERSSTRHNLYPTCKRWRSKAKIKLYESRWSSHIGLCDATLPCLLPCSSVELRVAPSLPY